MQNVSLLMYAEFNCPAHVSSILRDATLVTKFGHTLGANVVILLSAVYKVGL